MNTDVKFLRTRLRGTLLTAAFVAAAGQIFIAPSALAHAECKTPGCAGAAYANQPEIAPIGVRIENYTDVPESAKGPAIDPGKGYRTQDLGDGLYMVTENVYQAMFMVHAHGVIVIDAPPSLAAFIPKAIAEVTSKPITHVVYSHAHTDHIGATKALGGHPVIVAHEETARLLRRTADPSRPIPHITFFERRHMLAQSAGQLQCSPSRRQSTVGSDKQRIVERRTQPSENPTHRRLRDDRVVDLRAMAGGGRHFLGHIRRSKLGVGYCAHLDAVGAT